MNITVYGAASRSIDSVFLDATENLGAVIARRGHTLIFGGGDNGVMGASARGAYREKGEIIAVVPKFFNADGVLFPHSDRIIRTDTMRERKAMLEALSDGFIAAPGGVGTYDEFFEILTLKQLGRHTKPIVLYNPDGFYDGLIAFLDSGVERRFMNEKMKDLFAVFDDPEEAVRYIEEYVPVNTELKNLKDVTDISK